MFVDFNERDLLLNFIFAEDYLFCLFGNKLAGNRRKPCLFVIYKLVHEYGSLAIRLPNVCLRQKLKRPK